MPAVGSILQATPATYVNPYNYELTGTTTFFNATTITLDGGSAVNDAYVGYAICWLNLLNPGIARVITAYDGATKIATLNQSSWTEDTGFAPIGVAPTAGVSIWAICNLYPVDRRYQWIKDGVDISGAIGGAFTPYTAGSYQVRETAFYPNTSGLTTITTSPAVSITGTRDAALVYADNLIWQGCFYAPSQVSYGGTIAYYEAGNGGAGSLFVQGLDAGAQKIGEISIPTPGTTLGTVPTANLLNTVTLVDPLEGQRLTSGIVSGGSIPIGGLLVHDGKLIVTAHGSYEIDSKASWFWQRPLDLSTTGAVEGPFSVTDAPFKDNPRYYAGYLASVPASLQSKLGGPVVAGLAAGSVNSNTSAGPAYASFDPANFTTAAANVKRGTFVSATANKMVLSSGSSMSSTTDFYVGYWLTTDSGSSSARKVIAYNGTTKEATVDSNWLTTPTSGNWVLIPPVAAKAMSMYEPDQLQASITLTFPYIWDETSAPIGGYAIPNGTRSVLAFSTGGNNMYMYSSPGQVRNGVKAYDPEYGGTGEHNYPYYARCWAYDANELEQARLGAISPGSVKPYAVWNFTMPILNQNTAFGTAYDPVNKRLFLTNSSGPSARVVVHVYTVSNATYP